MSALAFEWMPTETETTTSVPAKDSREAEFRLALDGYIANYVAQQRRCTETVGKWRQLLAASREIWLFSHAVNRDWRGQSRQRRST